MCVLFFGFHMLTYRKIPRINLGAYIFQRLFLRGLFLEGLIFGGRPWRIVLLKVAYYATSSARNFAKLCSQNDVDSVHIGAQ